MNSCPRALQEGERCKIVIIVIINFIFLFSSLIVAIRMYSY